MRALLLVSLVALPCAAQDGVWTGYVGGWVRTGPPRAVPLVWQPSVPVVQQWLVLQRAEAATQERVEQARAQTELLRQQTELARQALATQEALALEQQQALVLEQQRLEQQRTQPADVAPIAAAPQPTLPVPSSPEPQRPEAGPKKKGPAIHSWVDEDGVTHYSTKTRAEAEKPKRK